MRWGHTYVIQDFGALVTDRTGAAANQTFRIPIGVLPASQVSQVAIAFMLEELPNTGATPQGSLTLAVDIGVASFTPRVLDDDAYAPLAREVRGEGQDFVVEQIEDVYTNRVYELVVLAPAQEQLVPIYLRVKTSWDPNSTEPTIWSLISAAVTTLVLGHDDTDANAAYAAELKRRLEQLEEQRSSFETGTVR